MTDSYFQLWSVRGWGWGQGGGNPGVIGVGSPQEVQEERAGDGISNRVRLGEKGKNSR